MINKEPCSNKLATMSVLNFLVLFGLISHSAARRDFVPVLIWGAQTNPDSKSYVSGLNKLDTDDFFNYLVEKVQVNRPNILLFVEENLSLEDFSWKDINEQGAFPLLSNTTKSADHDYFLPAVHDPYKAVRKLVSLGYTWRKSSNKIKMFQDDAALIVTVPLSEPDSPEGRPDLLRSHDIEITKMYNNVLKFTSNVISVYTGNHSSWIDANIKSTRVKRNEPENIPDEVSSSDTVLLMDSNKTVIMLVNKPIMFRNGSESYNLSDTASNPTIEKKKNKGIALDVNFKFKNAKPEIDFHFEGSENENWILSHVVVNENKDQLLIPSTPIEAPRGYSYNCRRTITFKDKNGKVSLTLKNIQVQPYVKEGRFGPAIDCVPYFSIAIWSGLFIVLILTLVLAWGIMMIMDINTMDRFDDAKGKTITITATD